MSSLYHLIVHALNDDVYREPKPFAILGFTKMYVDVDDGVASCTGSAHAAGHQLDRAEQARCAGCVGK